jgi:DNA-binding CsgD family transcriptional regulator
VANPRNASLLSDPGELRERIAKTLIEAGLEVEPAEASGVDELDGAVSGPVVTAGSAPIMPLRRRARDAPLVVVADGEDHQECRAAISAGADGAVLEEDVETALAATVAAADGGQVVFPASLLRPPTRPSFSTREKQVLGLIVLGFTNQEIATRLKLAETTIKSHLSSAYGKLGVSSRSQAAALILDTASGLGLDVLAIEQGEGRRGRG